MTLPLPDSPESPPIVDGPQFVLSDRIAEQDVKIDQILNLVKSLESRLATTAPGHPRTADASARPPVVKNGKEKGKGKARNKGIRKQRSGGETSGGPSNIPGNTGSTVAAILKGSSSRPCST